MDRLQQLYYTHCTYGTSLARGKSSHGNEQVYGYATRAASLPAVEAESLERDVQRLVGYHLPRDTPAEQRAQLTAATAPMRLMYYPNYAGRELAGQVCYRPFDSSPEGRVGSFFAHLVFGPRGSLGGGPLSVLRLWNAPGWRRCDGPDITHSLPNLDSLDDLLKVGAEAAPAAIDDRVLESFVAANDPSAIVDPHNIIPRYMRNASGEDRRMLLAKSLHGFLELDLSRESFLLVAPPELAGLIFYGMLRLVPEKVWGGDLSFATYVSDFTSLPASLVATTFANPHLTAPSSDEQRSAGFAINIFRGMKELVFRNPTAVYPYLIVDLLATRGFQAVDVLLSRAARLAVETADGVEHLAEAHQVTEKLLTTAGGQNASPTGLATLAEGLPRRYARLAIEQRLADGPSPDDLRWIAESPQLCLLFELLVEVSGETRTAIEACVPLLSDQAVAQLARHDPLCMELRKQLLLSWARLNHRLPEGLLVEFYRSPVNPPTEPSWATGAWREFIEGASAQDLWNVYREAAKHAATAKSGGWATFQRLLDVADMQRRREGLCDAQYPARRVLCMALDRAGDNHVRAAVQRFGESLTRNYIGKRLQTWCQAEIEKLSDVREASGFAARLDLLQRMLGDRLGRSSFQQYPSAIIDGWQQFREALTGLATPLHNKEKRELFRQSVSTFLNCAAESLPLLDRRTLFSAIVDNAPMPLEKQDRELLWRLFVLRAIKPEVFRCQLSPEVDAGGASPHMPLDAPVIRCDFPRSLGPSFTLALRVKAVINKRSPVSKVWTFEHGRALQPNLAELRGKRWNKIPLDHLQLSYELSAEGWPEETVATRETELRTKPDARGYTIRLIDGADRDQDDGDFLHGLLTSPDAVPADSPTPVHP